MNKIYSIIYFLILFGFDRKPPRECMKITCLNPTHIVSQRFQKIKSIFLFESLGDTISDFNIRPSCGCEYSIWGKGMKIFPNHPDTVIIISLVRDHIGSWLKQTTVSTNKCTQLIQTGPWVITE